MQRNGFTSAVVVRSGVSRIKNPLWRLCVCVALFLLFPRVEKEFSNDCFFPKGVLRLPANPNVSPAISRPQPSFERVNPLRCAKGGGEERARGQTSVGVQSVLDCSLFLCSSAGKARNRTAEARWGGLSCVASVTRRGEPPGIPEPRGAFERLFHWEKGLSPGHGLGIIRPKKCPRKRRVRTPTGRRARTSFPRGQKCGVCTDAFIRIPL